MFNEQLQKEFPFIKKGKTEYDVTCTHCWSNFSVAHGGRCDVKDHLQTDKHWLAVAGKASKGKTVEFIHKLNKTSLKLVEKPAGQGFQ